MLETIRIEDLYGDELRHRRLLAGMSVEDLANVADTTVWSIYDYENGHRIPDVKTAAIMYNRLGTIIEKRINESRQVRTGMMEPCVFQPIIIRFLYGAGLREHREEAGMSVEELSMNTGVSKSNIYRYENFRTMPGTMNGILIYNCLNNAIWHKTFG